MRGARTVAAYSKFDRNCIEDLRDNLPHLASELDDVLTGVVDLLPVVRDHVYHPDFGGSFSLKNVLPTLAGGMGYQTLDVAKGRMASIELERLMFDGSLTDAERSKLRVTLLAYCAMDTRALVELVKKLGTLA